MTCSNFIRNLLITIIILANTTNCFCEIMIFPHNGEVRIRNGASLWTRTDKQAVILPGDSIKTGITSECMVTFDKNSYLIARPDTLFTLSPSADNASGSACEINLIKGNITVKLSPHRRASYFAMNTGIVFGGIKTSRNKFSALFSINSREKTDLWSIYNGKINLIAKNPMAGSLSISNKELISITTNSILRRKEIRKIAPNSILGTMLDDQFDVLKNMERIEAAFLKSASLDKTQALKEMYLSLSSKGAQCHEAILQNTKKYPSPNGKVAQNLSLIMNECFSHLENRIVNYALVQVKDTGIRVHRKNRRIDETQSLGQLRLMLNRITEITKTISSKDQVRYKRIMTELRLMERQVEQIRKTDTAGAVHSMSNTTTRAINAVRAELIP